MRKKDNNISKRKQNNIIRILTYNLCWEAFEGAKTGIDMTKCIINSENKCTNNISKIILDFSRDYDFMAFQEVGNKEIEKLDLPESFIRKYSYETEKQNLDKVITYYNKNKYTLKKVVKGNICLNNFQRRSYLGLIFNEKVIIINVHFPHKDFNEILEKLIKKFSRESEFLDTNYNIILCGDFNHKPNVELLNKLMRKYGINKEFYEKNISFNTCCRSGNSIGKEYFGQFDNIITTFGKPITYETITDEKIGKFTRDGFTYTSDHLPVYAELKNINMEGGLNKEFYEKAIDEKIFKYIDSLKEDNSLENREILDKLLFYKKLIK